MNALSELSKLVVRASLGDGDITVNGQIYTPVRLVKGDELADGIEMVDPEMGNGDEVGDTILILVSGTEMKFVPLFMVTSASRGRSTQFFTSDGRSIYYAGEDPSGESDGLRFNDKFSDATPITEFGELAILATAAAGAEHRREKIKKKLGDCY